MNQSYADSKYSVIERKWFGLTKKHGGDAASGYTFATTDATKIAQLAYWRPKGPIKIVKAGCMRLATITNASVDLIPVRVRTRGASASLGCTFYAKSTATAQAPFTFASAVSFTAAEVRAGEYLSIDTGTPQTDNGTAANTATTTGTVAFFVDYVRKYDAADTNWDPTRQN
jgi:hypothetical protein